MLTIGTWNINSVRLRADLVARLLTEQSIDVLCLQELKTAPHLFPYDRFAELGYGHVEVESEPGYNGVGFVSRRPLTRGPALKLGGKEDARHLAVNLDGQQGAALTLHGLYVPSGGDTPDPAENDKFAHKLRYLDEMAEAFSDAKRALLMGDLNVAPLENDVWSHKQMLKVVSHTPIEVEKLQTAQAAGPWTDLARVHTPADEKLYSWWSYRARDWRASNRGRRLDHIWASPDIAGAMRSVEVVADARGWEQPSDHAPVIVQLDV